MEWVNSILAIPAPSSALQANRDGRALRGIANKGYTWKANERRTRVCKLSKFAAQMNQYRGIQGRFFE